jgi:hypothetical protein
MGDAQMHLSMEFTDDNHYLKKKSVKIL